MTMIGIGLMAFSGTLLIVSLYYIMTTTRHKERMAMIEKGLDPGTLKDDRFFLESIKFGFAMIGAGIGFALGVLIEDARLFSSDIEMPLYFAPILICSGIGLIIFYKKYGKSYKS